MSADEREFFSFEDLDDENGESGAIVDLGLHHTESIDLKGMMQELDSSFDEEIAREGFETTAFGKLMQALPIAALFIGKSRKIVFANQSFEKISPDYKLIEGESFDSLFPDQNSAAQIRSLVEKVFETRKTQVLEGILRIEQKKIWARAHLRSLWWGSDQSILVLVEDLTLEKTQLLLQKRMRKELEKRVQQRTADLRKINERLQQEIAERARAEAELRKHRQHLEELVTERTTEVRASLGRLKREIMERKQVEKSLRSSEHKFTVAFQGNPAAVAISTLDEGRYIEVNDSFCRLTGYDHDEIISHTAGEIKHWAKPSHRQEMVRHLMENGSVKDFETVFRSRSGKMTVVSLSAGIVELDGKPHILAIMTDVTDRKRAEADRTRMITAFEQAAETIVIADDKGIVRYANPAFESASGYSRLEVQGKSLTWFRSPENDQGMINEARQALTRGQTWRGRLINLKRDGAPYEVEASISPVKSKTGHIINFVVVERDVTDEVRLEKQMRQAQKMEAVGTLAGGLAHDFNNILMAMRGYAEMAARSIPEDSVARQDLDEIIQAGRRATDLVKQILTFSRQTEQEKSPVEVHRVFREALRLIRASIPSTIEIRHNIDPTSGTVMADPTQMHQILMNLCTNAYQAMEGGPGIMEVTVTEQVLEQGAKELSDPDLAPGPYVKLTVSDTGLGIAPELMERIFDPYFTTKEVGKGTGLGLSVVLGIVQSHGGAITVDSGLGRGTVVNVYLPRCKEEPEQVPTAKAPSETSSQRIMFIDDDRKIVELVRRTLEPMGYKLTTFTDPTQALEALSDQADDYDLIITDLTMPAMTGLDFAKALFEVRPGMPVVLCTGYTETLTRKKVREMGFVELLIKPIVPSVLESIVPDILRKIGEADNTAVSGNVRGQEARPEDSRSGSTGKPTVQFAMSTNPLS